MCQFPIITRVLTSKAQVSKGILQALKVSMIFLLFLMLSVTIILNFILFLHLKRLYIPGGSLKIHPLIKQTDNT